MVRFACIGALRLMAAADIVSNKVAKRHRVFGEERDLLHVGVRLCSNAIEPFADALHCGLVFNLPLGMTSDRLLVCRENLVERFGVHGLSLTGVG